MFQEEERKEKYATEVTERTAICSRNLATLSSESPHRSIIMLLPWNHQ
jgi:hypothetical protein